MHSIVELILFAAPCWIANMALNIFYFLKCKYELEGKIDHPIDFNQIFFDGRSILGGSTTVLGLPVALLFGIIGGAIFGNPILIGMLKGLTVYVGHGLGSFIKRRCGYQRGKFMPFVDHGDYIVFSAVVFIALGLIDAKTAIFSIIITYVLHPIVCIGAYKAGLRKDPL